MLWCFTLQIDARGGNCIPVQCDHSNDENVVNLFEKIKREQNGRLDVLVNNAYAAVNVSRPSPSSFIVFTVWCFHVSAFIPDCTK